MDKKIGSIITAVFLFTFMCVCVMEGQEMKKDMFSTIEKGSTLKEGVKQITYNQFMKIRKSGEKYVLLDVLPPDSYAKGHIEGAASFPVTDISEQTAAGKLSKSDNIVVYCGSFQCPASTEAAKKLSALGYNVLDYKGGLKEWQDKGNNLVK